MICYDYDYDRIIWYIIIEEIWNIYEVRNRGKWLDKSRKTCKQVVVGNECYNIV